MKRSDAKRLVRFVGHYFHATGAGVRGKLAEDFVRDVSEKETQYGTSGMRDFLGPEWRATSDPTPRPTHHVDRRIDYCVRLNCGHKRIITQYNQPLPGTGASCAECPSHRRIMTHIVAVEGIGQPPQSQPRVMATITKDELDSLRQLHKLIATNARLDEILGVAAHIMERWPV